VSRRFVALTDARVKAFMSRPLGDLDLPESCSMGAVWASTCWSWPWGSTGTGKKHVLGVVEGSTESEGVCRGLLGNLVERGLNVDRARLFVIDMRQSRGIRTAFRRPVPSVMGRTWAVLRGESAA
jgi:putative transposase